MQGLSPWMTSLLETDLEATRLQLYALLMTQAKQLGHLAPQFLNLTVWFCQTTFRRGKPGWAPGRWKMLQLCCHPTLLSSNADLHHGGGTLTEGTQEQGSVVVPKQHWIQGTGRGPLPAGPRRTPRATSPECVRSTTNWHSCSNLDNDYSMSHCSYWPSTPLTVQGGEEQGDTMCLEKSRQNMSTFSRDFMSPILLSHLEKHKNFSWWVLMTRSTLNVCVLRDKLSGTKKSQAEGRAHTDLKTCGEQPPPRNLGSPGSRAHWAVKPGWQGSQPGGLSGNTTLRIPG